MGLMLLNSFGSGFDGHASYRDESETEGARHRKGFRLLVV